MARPRNPLRARIADRLARMVDFRIEQKLRPAEAGLAQRMGKRMNRQRGRLNRHEEVIGKYRYRLDTAAARLDSHHRKLADLEKAVDQVRADLGWAADEVQRIIPQVVAQEDRIETLRSTLAVAPRVEEIEIAQARSLVEEIQRHHVQIRARLSGLAMPERVPE